MPQSRFNARVSRESSESLKMREKKRTWRFEWSADSVIYLVILQPVFTAHATVFIRRISSGY